MNRLSEDSITQMRKALGSPIQGGVRKGVTIASDLTYYDLMGPAKNLYPLITPLRNSIARVRRDFPGSAANWRVVQAITGSGYDSMGWIPEGQRSAAMSYTTASLSLPYVTLGEEDFLTFEAEAAAQGFEDENSMVTFRLLQKMMHKEEMAILGGNASIALGTPSGLSLSAVADTASTLPTATYYVKVVALSFEGYKNSSLAGGVATVITPTGADGKTYTVNGGSSAASTEESQAITVSTNHLACTVTPIQGALAYAWYVGTSSGGETLQAITTVASATFAAALTGSRQAVTAITADHSRNNGSGGTNPVSAFDGLLTAALNTNNNAYVNMLGAQLTSSGIGSVNEIDTMLQSMWDTYRVSPTVLYVNSQQLKDITALCLSNDSAPLLRYDVPGNSSADYTLTAAGTISFYYNPYSVDGGTKIPVKIHPDIPPGTILAYAEQLPVWYQSNEVPNVAEMLTRRDYYRIDWPLTTRQRQYGVYAEEVLAVYAPFAMGVLTLITPGT